MDSVFDHLDARDTVTVQGRYSSRLVVLSATGERLDRGRQFVPRLSLGWVPFVPAGLFIDGDPLEYLVSATFLLLLVAPAGYWAMFWRRNATGISVVIATMALAVGLYGVPGAFGISPAAPWEAASVILGGMCGGSLGWRATRRRPPAG
jgi:hypothetical protein